MAYWMNRLNGRTVTPTHATTRPAAAKQSPAGWLECPGTPAISLTWALPINTMRAGCFFP